MTRLAFLALFLTSAAPAHADCRSDMVKLANERNAALREANASGDWFWGKPGSPADFCPKGMRLVNAEAALIAFMVKNQKHCAFPDAPIADLEGHHIHNAEFVAGYCR